MEIDIRTLVIILGFTHLMQVLVFYHQFKVNKTYRGIGWWLLWSAVEVVGFGFILLRNVPSLLPIAIIVQNFMIVTGTVFLYFGVRFFLDKKANLQLIIPIVSTFAVGFLYFLLVNDNIQVRSSIFSATLALISFITAYSLFTDKLKSFNTAANFNAIIFVTHGCVFAFRMIMIIAGTPVDNIFSSDFFNLLAYFDALIVSLLWTFGLIIMLNQRLNTDIQETKNKLELIFNTSPDAVLITRLDDGLIVDVNEGYTAITGYSREEMIGKLTSEINIWKNIDDRQKIVTLLKNYGYCENLETTFVLNNGLEITGLISAKIIYILEIPHIISITRNISDRKRVEEELYKSESRFHLLFENMSEGVALHEMIYDEKGLPIDYRIVDVNDSFEKHTGISSQKARGTLASELYKLDTPPYLTEYSEVVRTNIPLFFDTHYPNLNKDFTISAISTSPGFFATIFQDITDRKQKEAEIQILLEKSEHSRIDLLSILEDQIIAQESLSKSEERYRNLLTNLEAGVVVHAPNTSILMSNNRASVLLGLSEDQMKGKLAIDPRWRFINENNIPLQLEEYPVNRIIATKKPFNNFVLGVELPTTNEITWLTVNGFPVLDSNDEITEILISFIEITERKKAEECLQKSEAKFRQIFELSPLGIVMVGLDKRFINCNDVFSRWLGYTTKELIGKTIDELTLPEDRHLGMTEMMDISKGIIEVSHIQKRYLHKNGNAFWGEVTISLVRNQEGIPQYFLAIIQDITERKLAEEKLKENLALLRIAGEKAKLGGWNVILGVNRASWSDEVATIHEMPAGYSPLVEEGLNFYAPEWRDKITEAFSRCAKEGVTYDEEMEILTSKGKRIWVRTIGEAVRDNNGKIFKIQGAFQDITERKKADEVIRKAHDQLSKILETSPGIVCTSHLRTDGTVCFPYGGERLAKYFGIPTAHLEEDATPYFNLIHPDDLQNLLASITESAKQLTPWRFEWRMNHPSKGILWIEGHSMPLRETDGSTLWHGVATDITERKRTEEILMENKSRLELAMQSANMAWWEMNITTGKVIFDKRKSDMLGYPAEKFSHYKDFMALVHPEDTDKTMQAMQRHIDGVADKYEIEYRILTKSGKYKWFYDIGTIVKKDPNGIPLNVTGLVIDITEQKRIDQKIREKDQEFRKLSANVPDLIYQFTRKTDGTYFVPIASEGIRNIFGCSPEDVLNDFTPIGRVIHPDDAERVIRDIEYSADHLTYFTCEFRVQIPGRETQWIYSKSTPERLPDGSITWYGFNTDITHRKLSEEALKKSEARFRSTLDNMIEGCQIIGFDWSYIYINSAAEQQNKRPSNELLGNSYIKMWPGVESTHLYSIMKDCLTNRQSHSFENEFVFPNGAKGWFYLSIQPIPEGIFILSEDITDKKIAEKEIKLKDSLLYLTGEMAKVGGWEFDVATMTGTWTDEVARIHDLDTSTQTSVELGIGFYQKESRKKIKEALKNAIENAEPYDLELEMVSAKGVHKWVRSMGIPLVENDKTYKVRGIFQDITEQKKANERLVQSELRFRTLVESAPEAIFIQTKGLFAFLNPAAQKLFKVENESQLIGKPVLDSFHPDYRETVKQRIHDLNVNRKTVPSIEEKCITVNGDPFDVEVSAVPFSYNNVSGALVFLHNITDRKIAENEIRELNEELEQKVKDRTIELKNALEFVEHIMANTSVGLSVYSNKGDCILANQAMAQIVGTTKENILLQNYHTIKSWKEVGLIEKAKTAIKEMSTQKMEFHTSTTFGKDVWLDCKFTPFKTFEQTNLLLTVTDITERMMRQKEISELNEELQSNIEKLENVNKELEAFSYSVSHDLRGPLRAIHGFIQILHEDYYQKIDSEADRLMTIVQENTLRMGQLIDDLLAFSRISRTEIKKSSIDSNSIVKSIIEEFKYQEKNCKAEFKVANLPSFQGDPNLFHQVWANLLSNAVKYSSKVEKPLVEIGFTEDNHFYEFYIRDNGAGFEMQYADKLFKVFQRLHNNREFEGTGVGLAIIQRIVSRHGGDVRATGDVNKGATFYFTVPK